MECSPGGPEAILRSRAGRHANLHGLRSQRALRDEINRVVEEKRWKMRVRRAKLCRVDGGPIQGRPYELVESRDAAEVYAAVHRSRVLVLATCACFIRRDPSANPSRYRDLISLEGFIRYKADFGMIRAQRDIARFFERFTDWLSTQGCTDSHDPRVLPLHVFDNSTEWTDLNDPKAIRDFVKRDFVKRFGPGSRRIDVADRSWGQAGALHGGDVLTVAGLLLARGFHWDVLRGRGAEKIITSHEIWRLYNEKSYCNIYPDEYVREGSPRAGGMCRKVWPSRDRIR